jgi:hypothetical protein
MVAALGSASALAQTSPGSPSAAGAAKDDGSATAGSSLERSSQSYDSGNSGRDAAKRLQGGGTSDGMAGDTAAGSQGAAMDSRQPMDSSPGSTTTFSGTGAETTGSGAAGRTHDGSKAAGPASRADVAADRDRALRSERWIFNDLDGVRRLDPGENSFSGRVYKGPADSY